MINKATFAGGCFWCTEAVFKRVKGVTSVKSGYSGGTSTNPDYEELHYNNTGHAECIQIEFDPNIISYEKLVEIFFGTHDPTQLNRQGNDVGEEYRSIIFFHDEEQKKIAELVKERLTEENIFNHPIVTTIEPFTAFYEAESEHHDFYDSNPNQPYCRFVIDPKIAKLRKKYSDYLK